MSSEQPTSAARPVQGLFYVFRETCQRHFESMVYPAIIISGPGNSAHVKWCYRGNHFVSDEEVALIEMPVADKGMENGSA